jgi:tetratricopeptide (TPR) repeat protein
VDKSLVQRRPGDRYASHPLVRQYAAARLAADDDRRRRVRARHAQVVFGMLEPPGAARSHPDLPDEAVVAWRYAVDQADLALMRRAVEGLVELLDAAGRYRHGLELFESAASTLGDGAEPATAAALRYGEAWILERLGRHADAVDKAGRAVGAAEAAGERRLLARSLLALAWARKTVDGDRAQYAVTRQALPVAESLDDDRLVAQVRNGLGCSAPTLEECREHLREGLAVATEANLPDLAARLSGNLGLVVACLGDPDEAKRCLANALTFARSTAWLFGLVEFLSDLVHLHAELGELDTAQGLSAEAEDLLSSAESVDQKIYATLVAGEIHRLLGDPALAETRMRYAMRLAHAVGNQSLMLRSLRLHGRLLIDAGRLDDGLRVLAVVLAGPTRQGDFTSELLNPRIWAEHTAGIAPERVRLAQAWARVHGITDTVADVLAQTGDGYQFVT